MSLPATYYKNACDFITRDSWHHTSSYCNETNHYKLSSIIEYLLNQDDYEHLKTKKQVKNNNFKYGVIEVNVWGGTRKNPKIIGTDTQIGIIIGEWLHYPGGKYKLSANKTIWFREFNTYSELTKKYPEHKSKIKTLNKILKDLKLK